LAGFGWTVFCFKKDERGLPSSRLLRDRFASTTTNFWTTQKQFWQWVREGVIEKVDEQPLRGEFRCEHEELMVLISNTVLNLAHPNHMREALLSRKAALR
jgi:hypothetical protein